MVGQSMSRWTLPFQCWSTASLCFAASAVRGALNGLFVGEQVEKLCAVHALGVCSAVDSNPPPFGLHMHKVFLSTNSISDNELESFRVLCQRVMTIVNL